MVQYEESYTHQFALNLVKRGKREVEVEEVSRNRTLDRTVEILLNLTIERLTLSTEIMLIVIMLNVLYWYCCLIFFKVLRSLVTDQRKNSLIFLLSSIILKRTHYYIKMRSICQFWQQNQIIWHKYLTKHFKASR